MIINKNILLKRMFFVAIKWTTLLFLLLACERTLKIFKRFLPEGHSYIKIVQENLLAVSDSESASNT